MHARQHLRVAANQARIKRMNDGITDRVERFRGDADEGRMYELMCECSLPECEDMLFIAPGAYARIRANDAWLIVRPEHHTPRAERVLEQHQHYWVIEPFGATTDQP